MVASLLWATLLVNKVDRLAPMTKVLLTWENRRDPTPSGAWTFNKIWTNLTWSCPRLWSQLSSGLGPLHCQTSTDDSLVSDPNKKIGVCPVSPIFFFFRVINLFSGHCCRRTWHRTRVGLGEDQLEIRPPCQEKINKKYPPTNFWSPQIFEHD